VTHHLTSPFLTLPPSGTAWRMSCLAVDVAKLRRTSRVATLQVGKPTSPPFPAPHSGSSINTAGTQHSRHGLDVPQRVFPYGSCKRATAVVRGDFEATWASMTARDFPRRTTSKHCENTTSLIRSRHSLQVTSLWVAVDLVLTPANVIARDFPATHDQTLLISNIPKTASASPPSCFVVFAADVLKYEILTCHVRNSSTYISPEETRANTAGTRHSRYAIDIPCEPLRRG